MPVWHRSIHLEVLVQQWKDGGLDIEELAELVVGKIRRSGWRELTHNPDLLDDLLDELSEVLNENEYTSVFNDLYDLADADRVWIQTS